MSQLLESKFVAAGNERGDRGTIHVDAKDFTKKTTIDTQGGETQNKGQPKHQALSIVYQVNLGDPEVPGRA